MALDIVNPIQNISYVNKDFEAIYPELLDLVKQLTYKWDPSISNESDPGVILLKLNAIIGDKLNYNLDKNILECFPLSVTQISNARQLFAQNGYYMKWYKGATTNISIKWKASNTHSTYTIPAFTRVSDYDNTIVYTLIGPATSNEFIVNSQVLNTDGSVTVFKAIQGTAVNYDINGETLIKYSMLDSNNRIYFNTTDIAENGIFIRNTNKNNYSQWKKVDNLTIQTVNSESLFYKFGVTSDGNSCYVEFPENADTIFGEGINIVYIKTNGENGNIPAFTIEKFYNDLVPVEDTGIILNADNVVISNPYSAGDGANPESINEAYRNYKRTIGTFDTLVTLRDYFNYIVTSGLVSNCMITDRTNDPQCSYKIVHKYNNVDNITTQITSSLVDGRLVPDLTAYSLKLYLLKYVSTVNDFNSYNQTFSPLNNASTIIVKNYLQQNKSIQHDYVDLTDETGKDICFFKNYYPINCTIATQYALTKNEASEVISNIKLAIYENLNSKVIDFGDEIPLDYVKNIILNSDRRIKDVIMSSIEYTTKAVKYVEGIDGNGTFVEIDINEDNSALKNIYAKAVLAGVTQFFIKDEEFDYQINQIYLDKVNNIKSLSSNVNIAMNNASSVYDLKPNENLQFFAPNLVETSSYSNYVKAEWNLESNITANENYQLKGDNEYIAFYWRDSNDVDSLYNYKVYRKGNIICPNIDLNSQSPNRPGWNWFSGLDYENIGTAENPILIASTDYNGPLDYGVSNSIQTLTESSQILSNNKTIVTKAINSIELNSSNENYYCYWILNDIDDDRYVLFDSSETEYMLDTGEYFLYANSSLTQLNILGAGTTIKRSVSTDTWAVVPIPTSNILNNGLSAFNIEDWFKLTTGTITIQENQYVTLGYGTQVRISGLDSTGIVFNGTTPVDVSDYKVKYIFKDAPGVEYSLPDLNISGENMGWKGKSLLSINLGYASPQILLDNQSIYCTLNDDSVVTINGSGTQSGVIEGNFHVYPVVLLGSKNINFSGAGSINVYEKIDEETIDYLTLYKYKELIDGYNGNVTFNSDSNMVFTFPPGTTSYSFTSSLPIGEYIIPISIPDGINFTAGSGVHFSWDGNYLYTMASKNSVTKITSLETSGTHYLYLNVDSISVNGVTATLTIPEFTVSVNISINNIYKYRFPEDFTQAQSQLIEDTIAELDPQGLFDYVYEVDPDVSIPNPIEPSSFVDTYHPLNPYTICQFNTDNDASTFKILNIRRD